MKRACLLIAFSALTIQSSLAQVPRTISYQGVLTDESGVALPDGDYSLAFTLFDAESGGFEHWSETQVVPVQDGKFNALLGSVNPFNTPFDIPFWLGIRIGEEAELTPRLALTSSAYSLSVADSTVNGAKIILGEVVRSINSVTDHVTLSAGPNVTITPAGNTLTISADGGGGGGGITAINAGPGLTGGGDDREVTLELDTDFADGRYVDEDQAGSITDGMIQDGALVKSINSLKDDVTLSAGANVTITPAGNTLTVSATGGEGDGHSLDAADGTPTDAMFVANDGNVGIGTTTPSFPLHIKNTAGEIGLRVDGDAIPFSTIDVNAVGSATWPSFTYSRQGTEKAIHYVGPDGEWVFALDSRVAFRIAPATSDNHDFSANIIGGSLVNSVGAGVVGASIVGGGAEDDGSGSPAPNTVTENFGTVGGGAGNAAGNGTGTAVDAMAATVGGGWKNEAIGIMSSVGGDRRTKPRGGSATVGGGHDNIASGDVSTVSGGANNHATDWYSTIPGGQNNRASGFASLAAGTGSDAKHLGTFVWSDASSSQGLTSTGDDQFLIRASGGVGIGTNIPQQQLDVGTGNIQVRGVGGFDAPGEAGIVYLGGIHHYIKGEHGFGVKIGTYAVGDAISIREISGDVGIGTTVPVARLSVDKQNGPAASFNRISSDGPVISIRQEGIEEGTISVSGFTVSYNAFTGSHFAWTDQAIERGMLVSLTGVNRRSHSNPEAEIIYGVVESSKANDPRIMGSYLGLQETNEPAGPENPHLVMAVGNGEMWVVDAGADIEIGDYLMSSSTPGHAMRDAGDYDISNIIARAAEPVVWASIGETVGSAKHKKISVFFESFVRNHTLERTVTELNRVKAELIELKQDVLEIVARGNEYASGR